MPTKKPRYAVSFNNDEVRSFLKFQSKEKRISISRVIADLVENAMDDLEDRELSKIAAAAWERNKDKPTFSHEEVMRECGLM